MLGFIRLSKRGKFAKLSIVVMCLSLVLLVSRGVAENQQIISESELPVEELVSFINDYEAKVIPLSKEKVASYINASITGLDSDYERAAKAQLELEAFHSDTTAFKKVKSFRLSAKVSDPSLRRQLEIMYLSYFGKQIDQKTLEELINRQSVIEQKFNTYRVNAAGRELTDNQVDSILINSNNSSELEEVWRASKRIGNEVAAGIIELAKLRNQAARSLGFKNFYRMKMKLREQNPNEIVALFDQLDSLTRGDFESTKAEIDSALAQRYKIEESQLRPWHYHNRFFQTAPRIYDVNLDLCFQDKDPVAICREYFAGIGLPVDSILVRSDLYEKPGKTQGAFCLDIDRSGDVRIVCNMKPDYEWVGVLLHELGHGVYSYYNDRQKPWLLRNEAHIFAGESIAYFFHRLAGNPEWLEQVVGISKDDVAAMSEKCRRMNRMEKLVFSRFVQVMARFERALYENPDQNLNKLWWDLVEKYQGVSCPKGRDEPDWASKIHIAVEPVYYHNYLIADLLTCQFVETVGRKILNSPDPFNLGFTGNHEIGKFFVDNVFHPGMLYPWNEMIRRATGEELTSVYYARMINELK